MFRCLLSTLTVVMTAMALILGCKSKDDTYARDEKTLAEGRQLYARNCTSCHELQQDGMGPRLGGITLLRSEKELTGFIRNPGKSLESGDARAAALRSRYKQIMPSFEWMDQEAIHSVLSYIHHQTEQYRIPGLSVENPDIADGALTGALVTPPKRSGLKIALEDVVRIPRLDYSSPDLGIATLRPHPSGDGTLFVSDQGGIIYRIANGKAEVFLDMRAHIKDFSIGPGIATGLGSFDFDPDFLNNGLIYITHAEKYRGQRADYCICDSARSEVQWVLSEWRADDVNSKVFNGTRRELLRLHAPTFGHGAQDLEFIQGLDKKDPDYGLLYWGFGDGGSNNIRKPELGHHLSSFLGSILRIDPKGHNSGNGKYGIPPDNPFVHDKDSLTLKEIWAYGFRNPHRMSWDLSHGKRMIVTDIGESNIEELNIVEKGRDYGWPVREGNFGINTKKDLKSVYRLGAGDLGLYTRPFAVYDHTIGNAISGGYMYEGSLEALKDKYVFGDIVNGRLFYVNMDKTLADSAIYEIAIIKDGKETSLREMSHAGRMHLRIGYDRFSDQLYVITKVDGMIRRVTSAAW